jgi:hypothetical protein
MKYLAIAVLFILGGCGQSALDNCTDSKSYLWNDSANGNEYKGNEKYWNAVNQCEDEHG